MAATTRADSLQRYALLLFAALLGIALLALSFPRLRAELAFLPVETALRNNWNIRPISRDRFPSLIEDAEQSIAILPDSRYQHGLAWMHYLYAGSLGFETEDAKKSLALTQRAFEARLKSSPAEPAEWLRLGWTHVMLNHPANQIIGAWKMSVFTGRAEHYLLLDRLELGLRFADAFEEDDLNLLRDQTLLSWKYRKQDMKRFFQERSINFKTLQSLLYNQAPEVLAEIEKEYANTIKAQP